MRFRLNRWVCGSSYKSSWQFYGFYRQDQSAGDCVRRSVEQIKQITGILSNLAAIVLKSNAVNLMRQRKRSVTASNDAGFPCRNPEAPPLSCNPPPQFQCNRFRQIIRYGHPFLQPRIFPRSPTGSMLYFSARRSISSRVSSEPLRHNIIQGFRRVQLNSTFLNSSSNCSK